ncbi:MAG: hypothetical protein J6M27_02105, partial [Lachnospiraceae bacterium]|nr:hypothetical protein [Lachnospiraceae bacterium]
MDEGITVGINIAKKGYQVFFQAANTLAYNDDDLIRLADRINEAKPVALSIVDTFGAMYADDLDHIVQTLHRHLDPEIMLAFHSHNNQQLSFALSMQFVETMLKLNRPCMVDGTLCGMGRGAGNTPTELLVSYLNRKHHTGYDINAVMDTIDMYMTYFQEHFSWGYSTPYFIAGLYCCHVNNIAYLLNNHRTNARDMRNVINALSAEDRRKYDYDLLERTYMETLAHKIDHSEAISTLRQKLVSQKILLIAPGRSILKEKEKIHSFIEKESPLIIMVNALNPEYQGDYFFVVNSARYEYARQIYPEQFHSTPRIVLSNIKATTDCEDEYLINFNSIIKRGWPHFDNSVITCLRFLDYLGISDVTIAGFDGFGNVYNESYADISLPTLNPNGHWEELNEEIKDM